MASITLPLPEALTRAVKDLREGNLFEAEQLCRGIIAKKHDFFDALHLLAIVLARLERNEEALANYERALVLRPGHAEALNNRGVALQELGRLEDALSSYDQALTARPDYVEALFNRSNALKEIERYEEALAGYEQVLARQPDYANAHNNRGLIFHHMKRFEDAVASYDKALAAAPNHFDALNNRGNSLKELKRHDEAIANYERALTLRPEDASALNNYGITLKEMRRFTDALASFERAQAARPDYAEAHLGEAELRLLTGDFSRGWGKYEWRWKVAMQRARDLNRDFHQPLWLGASAIEGKTILVPCEQGFGSTIQFCRYVPLLVERGARVILQVQKPLQELMTSLAGASQVIARDEARPDFDIHCPLLSLPLAFATSLETIPARVPYLATSKAHLKKWTQRLPKPSGPRIGLGWAGNPNFKSDFSRSIGLPPMLPLLARTDLHFFGLQKDLREGDREILRGNPLITHLGDEIETFSDTAAIISLLDLVISSDTSIVHLACALGKPVWILLPFVPDWRWLLDRDDSPWYPTARLFRQTETREWQGVIRRVQNALRDLTPNLS
jgi:tetratricopeptide (TPR) repeat protein